MGYKINTSKTEALPIHIPPSDLATLQQNYPYHWCLTFLKYLGINFTPSYSTLYQAISPTLLWHWPTLDTVGRLSHLSLLGRINVLKMSVLQRLLYLFETLPVLIPMSQLKVTHRAFLNFIWHYTYHRIDRRVMLAPRMRGRLGTPDLIKYYYATHLKPIIAWSFRMTSSVWMEIEMSVTRPVHPCSMVWASLESSMGQLRSLCLHPMLFTLSIWRNVPTSSPTNLHVCSY